MKTLFKLLATTALFTSGAFAQIGPPPSGGGGSTPPGGSSGQIEWNNGGTFGGFTAGGDATITPSTGAVVNLKVNGVSFSASPATNTIPVVTGTNTVTYETAPVTAGGTGKTTFTANAPLIGAGSAALTQGTRSGSTVEFGTINGSLTSGDCINADASGNLVDSGSVCATPGGADFAIQYNNASSFGGITPSSMTGVPLISNGTGSASSFGTAAVAGGGTGITSGTSGGILYFSASGTLASSGVLTGSAVVLGGGSGVSPTTVSGLGTTGQVLTSNGALSNPTWQNSASSGTVTSVSVVSANGLAGTVANPTTTPALTLSTSVTGVLQGNGTAISAATTTGTGSVVLATSPTLVIPALGTPSALVCTNCTGLPVSTGISGLGTGVATALGDNVGSAGAFVVNGGAGGTPSSITLSNGTGLPLSTGVTGTLPAANMLPLATNDVYQGNGSNQPVAVSLSAAIDAAIGLTQGDILYRNSTSWVVLAPGTSGQFLETLGASANPAWATVSSSGCTVSGGAQFQILVNNGSSGCSSDANASVNAGALSLGASGTAGSVALGNATSGTVTLQPVTGALGAVTASLPANTGTIAETNLAQTWSAAQTINSGDLLLAGSSSGTTTLNASATASGVITVPAGTATLATTANINTSLPSETTTTPYCGTGSAGVAGACGVTGTGSVVLATSPTLVTPALGTPASGVATNLTGTAASLTAGTATAANGLNSATTTVVVNGATAPSSGQVLTATSSTAATWQTPSGGGTSPVLLATLTASSATFTGVQATTALTIASCSSGTPTAGQTVAKGGITTETLTSLSSGTACNGVWLVSVSQTIASTTLTSATTSFVDTTHITSTYPSYNIKFLTITPQVTSTLEMFISTNGGSSYDTTSSNYQEEDLQACINNAIGATGCAAVGSTAGLLSPNFPSTSSTGVLSGTLNLYNPSSTLKHTAEFLLISAGGSYNNGGTGYTGSTSAINAFEIIASGGGGWLSGSVEIYGVP